MMNAVLVRRNSMALCHWCSERHRHGFGSSAIAAIKWSLFLSSSDFLSNLSLRLPDSSFSRSKQQKGRIKDSRPSKNYPFLCGKAKLPNSNDLGQILLCLLCLPHKPISVTPYVKGTMATANRSTFALHTLIM